MEIGDIPEQRIIEIMHDQGQDIYDIIIKVQVKQRHYKLIILLVVAQDGVVVPGIRQFSFLCQIQQPPMDMCVSKIQDFNYNSIAFMNPSKFFFVLLPIFTLISCWTVNTDTRNLNGTNSGASLQNKELKPTPKFDKNAKHLSLTGSALVSYDCKSIMIEIDKNICISRQEREKVRMVFDKLQPEEKASYDCNKFPDSKLIEKCLSYKTLLIQKKAKG